MPLDLLPLYRCLGFITDLHCRIPIPVPIQTTNQIIQYAELSILQRQFQIPIPTAKYKIGTSWDQTFSIDVDKGNFFEKKLLLVTEFVLAGLGVICDVSWRYVTVLSVCVYFRCPSIFHAA